MAVVRGVIPRSTGPAFKVPWGPSQTRMRLGGRGACIMRAHSERAARVHELDKVPAGEGGGDLEASRIGMLLYSCIWGDDQPPESRPTHLVRSARCGVENPLVGKAQTPENGTGSTLHSLPGLGVHLEPQETQCYDVIHAPNTDSVKAQQAYQPHINVGSSSCRPPRLMPSSSGRHGSASHCFVPGGFFAQNAASL